MVVIMCSEKTTITVSRRLKAELDKLKVHRREPYEDVIWRLIEKWREQTRS